MKAQQQKPLDPDSQLFWYQLALKRARKIIILVVGVTIILLGVVLIFLPGPAFIVIPLGLLVLATEFVWARRLLKKIKSSVGPKNEKKIDEKIKKMKKSLKSFFLKLYHWLER